MNKNALKFAVIVAATAAIGFVSGVARTRALMVEAAEELAANPETNTFSKCLTEGWEATGELGDWRHGRKWVLEKK